MSTWFFSCNVSSMVYILHDFGYYSFITYVNAVKTNHCVWCVARLTRGIVVRGEIISFYIIFFRIHLTRAPFKTSRLNRYWRASLATAAAAATAAATPSIATAGHNTQKEEESRYYDYYYYYYIHLSLPHCCTALNRTAGWDVVSIIIIIKKKSVKPPP